MLQSILCLLCLAIRTSAFVPDLCPRPLYSRVSARSALRAATPLLNVDSIEPTAEELTNENLVRIVREECTDDEVNELVWKCLGYRPREDGGYNNENVFPKWKEKYPSPPDLVGVTRTYSKQVDEPVLRANQALVNSIPMKYKGGIKEHLAKVGWTGFMLEGLTPNKTRRAQCTNWLLFYREALFGLTLDQLVEQKQRDIAAENQRLREEGKALRMVGPDGVVSGAVESTQAAQAAEDNHSKES